MTNSWEKGLRLVREGAYWEAHEALEARWHATDKGCARDAIQALIQFAAAAYKIEQAREGRAPESMQRGMAKLIDRALSLVDGSTIQQVGWEVDALAAALRELDGVRGQWVAGASNAVVAEQAHEVATRLVDTLAAGDAHKTP
jgi:predicted metal-dependent hydrolase